MRNTQKYPFSVLFNSIFFLYKTWMSVRISKLIEVSFQKFNLIFFVRVKYKKIHSMNFAVHKSVFQTSLFSIPNGQTVGTVFVIQDYLPILFNESTKNLFCKKYLIGKSCKMLFRLHYFFWFEIDWSHACFHQKKQLVSKGITFIITYVLRHPYLGQ